MNGMGKELGKQPTYGRIKRGIILGHCLLLEYSGSSMMMPRLSLKRLGLGVGHSMVEKANKYGGYAVPYPLQTPKGKISPHETGRRSHPHTR
jgi:hypothetical protein